MAIDSDPAKRRKTLVERHLDFQDAEVVFAGATYTFQDLRKDYGEIRHITVGLLAGRMVIVGWTMRESGRRVFSMRKANDREQARYASLLRRSPDWE